ncbi:hypothetical protein GCM10010954_30500 [Halobacillus andaensis]|uniref:Uncharacterized protein n=1 Tax=Halobacillus andaensis TaxID=1176239 RepID=A0A917B867_HALAA|nr:hypothetical protein [Halobacillus andaensis]MBP2005156.1 hypothetical protein [Halobacillus andaensis]GGF29266.1 hypothetical protein GCM10010954_30500 [Halobacillus andaensis]
MGELEISMAVTITLMVFTCSGIVLYDKFFNRIKVDKWIYITMFSASVILGLSFAVYTDMGYLEALIIVASFSVLSMGQYKLFTRMNRKLHKKE